MRYSYVAVVCLLVAANAMSATQPLDSIRSTAEDFVRAQLPAGKAKQYVTAAELDPRLRLDDCVAPLEAFSQTAANKNARMTIGVRCTTANPWTVFVPVTVEVEASVLVLRRPLARRARVAPTDVEPQARRLPGSAATFISDVSMLQGHRLKRSLPVGTALTVDMLAPDLLVRRGQQVTLIAATGSVEIRAQGQALTEGGASQGLERLLAWCDPSRTLRRRWAECAERAARCRNLNDRNGALVTVRLKNVEGMLDVLTGRAKPKVYGRQGTFETAARDPRVLATV